MSELNDLNSDAQEFYDANYQICAFHPLVTARPIRFEDSHSVMGRRCRFCGHSAPKTTFQNIAHAVPEFLGNKSLISMNECDRCNTFLAAQYEDHLAKRIDVLRTISQIAGKKGVPIYKRPAARIEKGAKGMEYRVVTDADLEALLGKEGPISLPFPVETPSQRHVPLNAAKALLKIACSICPESEFPHLQPVVDWLMQRHQSKLSPLPVLTSFTPGPNPYGPGFVALLRRKVDTETPYYWLLVGTGNYRFQIFVPFCPNEEWARKGGEAKFQFYHFPDLFAASPYGASKSRVEDWSSSQPTVVKNSFTLHVERAVKIA